jgi:dihydroorotase
MFDRVLKGGRLIDPAQGVDARLDVAFANGKVAEVGPELPGGEQTRDVSGLIVVPGLIDLHTHLYWGGTSLRVDPDVYAKASGLTTLIETGQPEGLPSPRDRTIRGAHPAVPQKADADLVVGNKVRIGGNASGASGIAPMEMALEVAEHAGVPLMTHLDAPPPYRSEVMPLLCKGDILTHCFRPFPNTPVAPGGAVREDVLAARERRVVFDIGRGKGSFGYETAMAMLKRDFLPDVISSDIHVVSIDGPAYDLLTTMSNFLALGVSLVEVIRATTVNPARAVRLEDRGTLRPGLLGDATVLTLEQGRFTFEVVLGAKLNAEERLTCRGIVLGGRWWHE